MRDWDKDVFRLVDYLVNDPKNIKSWCVITLVYCSYLCIYIFSTV
jgi:hypothetical protein